MESWAKTHYDKKPPYRQNIHPAKCTNEGFKKSGEGINERDYGHGGTSAFIKLYGRKKFEEYKKYIVIRHPLDQCKSILNQFAKHNLKHDPAPNQWGTMHRNKNGVLKAVEWIEARLKDFFILEKQEGVMFDNVVKLENLTNWFENLYESNGEEIKWNLTHRGNESIDVKIPKFTNEDLNYINNAEYMKYVRETYCE